MRIQHNIMAMNAYRNYNNNTSAVSKNLEKLSSGYKINRAGDDAAGLAISEKMRAQISGLSKAQDNVKDGISLVKTAEGALQEVQDMMNRMYKLSVQSANGTFDNEVDRANLQKEVQELKKEINRIADSSNFNGIKLLDGTWAGSGATAGVSTLKTDLATKAVAATAGSYTAATINAAPTADGDTVSYTVALNNGKSFTVDLTFKDDGTTGKLVDADGNEYKATQGGATATEIGDAVASALKEKLGKDFDITNTSGALKFVSKTPGTAAPEVTGLSQTSVIGGTTTGPTALAITRTAPTDAKTALLNDAFVEYDGTNEEDAVFELNGKKFVIADTANVDVSKLSDKGIVVISGSIGDTDGEAIAQQLAQKTGMTVEYLTANADGKTAGAKGFQFSAGAGSASQGGLRLQIGDTSEAFNQMDVIIDDMHTKALGIDGVDIGDQDGAAAAIDVLKAAINKVSMTRGTLGATQNRLEHTQNNLSVMEENIQDAEATIRDTDVAKEMMSYTKNNILVQSAQAMLAQANQVPQGVLQLLG